MVTSADEFNDVDRLLLSSKIPGKKTMRIVVVNHPILENPGKSFVLVCVGWCLIHIPYMHGVSFFIHIYVYLKSLKINEDL